jgi:hypothetical protein
VTLDPAVTPAAQAGPARVTRHRAPSAQKEGSMVPLLLWILGVPGVLIILLLLLGILHL